MEIEIHDDLIPWQQKSFIWDFVRKSTYKLGWEDRDDIPISNIYSSWTLDEFRSTGLLDVYRDITSNNPDINVDNFERCVVNLSKSGDYNFCHTHKGQIVFLYYVNLTWRDGYGGETLFYDEELKNANKVCSFVPGRILIFDGEIPHTIRAQSTYGPDYRFTISYFIIKESYAN